jgi:Xaa-Pro dipeptidase
MIKKNRVERILKALEKDGITQMLIVDPMTIYYLTDVYLDPFERFYGLYLRADGNHKFFLNKLFNVPDDQGIEKVWHTDTDPVMEQVAKYLDHDSVLGVDKDLKARFLLPLSEAGAAKGFVNTSLAVDQTRAIKDEEEQALMREASRVNDCAIQELKKLVHEGVTEKEIADQLLGIYQSMGAQAHSFDPLVAFGANAADPHHAPDDTVLKAGDCVLFDIGCIKDGYCSDMTRTYYYKEVSEEHRKIYELVRKANEEAIKKVKAGVVISTLDDTAREIISAEGYGENFNHRLGHFIGLTDHEFGDVSSVNHELAKPGMCFSIEPGIYVEGDTGVRVEDLVIVTEDGCEVLNHVSKELEIIE